MNKTQWFKAAHGKQVRKTITGVPTKEDAPQFIETIKQQLINQGANEADIEITERKVSIGSQFWLLPAFEKEVTAVFTSRSRDYIHNEVFGDKKDAVINADGNMTKRIPHSEQGLITFEILA